MTAPTVSFPSRKENMRRYPLTVLFPRFVQPVLSRVIKDEEDPEDALGEAIPDLLQALSMGLPCREMCDAVTRTCGCGDPETFGEVSARSGSLEFYHVGFGYWVRIWS
jgi:hypothetical protein